MDRGDADVDLGPQAVRLPQLAQLGQGRGSSLRQVAPGERRGFLVREPVQGVWLQAVFLWVIAAVVQYPQVHAEPSYLTVWDAAGVLVWAVGFLFETAADGQLARFKADPRSKGRVMDRGLWRYSRHPNYFGECLIWWGLFLVAFSVPGGIWTAISPIIITLVLLKMTGVPLTERTTMERRPGYRDYMRRTSTFLPWFPKKEEP